MAALVQAQLDIGRRGGQWSKPKGSDPHEVFQSLERNMKVHLSANSLTTLQHEHPGLAARLKGK